MGMKPRLERVLAQREIVKAYRAALPPQTPRPILPRAFLQPHQRVAVLAVGGPGTSQALSDE